MNDQAIFVPGDIKDDTIVRYEINCRTKHLLDVGWAGPMRLAHKRKPNNQRCLGLWMPDPEVPQGFASDDLHEAQDSLFPEWEQAKCSQSGNVVLDCFNFVRLRHCDC